MLTLTDLLHRTVECYGARIAIRDPSGNMTWQAYLARVARHAGMLRALGMQPGDRFATLSRNSVRHAELLLAGYWAGIIPVPLNFRLASPEIAAMLEDAACKHIFVDEAFLPLFEQPEMKASRRRAIGMGLQDTANALPQLDALLANATPIPAHEASEDDDALLLYTGGTTGRGKGVRLTHRNIVANALQLARTMSASEDDIYLHMSPMFHSTDLKATVVTMFGGGHVYLRDASPALILETIERYGVTIASLVPTMIIRILKEAQVERYDLRRLRLISYGTAPIDEQWLRKAMQAFASTGFHQCYGLTETSPYLAILDEAAHRRAVTDRPDLLRAAGRALPGTGVRIVDLEGADVAPGGIGEIAVTGPQVFKGYLNRPEEQAKAFRDGWFYTGDIGRMDDEGYLHVLDRKKEVVITGGENVYTREVETVLLQHPDIAEAAVLGVPDADYGEALLAVLVCASAKSTKAEEIIAFCRSRLGGFKIPRQFMYVRELPRTPLGKVQKHALRRAYLAGAARENG
jgi:long-chain acyl-CoA synthetase